MADFKRQIQRPRLGLDRSLGLGDTRMIDGNHLRAEFARYLNEHTRTRWGLDAALMHVCKIAYDQGLQDGASEQQPATQKENQ